MLVYSYKQLVGKRLGITTEEVSRRIIKWGKSIVVPNYNELSTKLSPPFSTRFAEIYPTIHRLYYYYNLY